MGSDGFKHYPAPHEIDQWVESLWESADSLDCRAEVLKFNANTHVMGNHHNNEFTYVKFSPAGGGEFYGYWQPAHAHPAPLLVHVPGYGAEMSTHPELVFQGFHVLHISPLGYATPSGPDESKKKDGNWPVLPDTAASYGKSGYREWLLNCMLAVRWAQSLPEVIDGRVSFFGTSQGGGGALLLGSVFRDRGARCVAADVPFLTNFPLADGRGAYSLAIQGLAKAEDEAAAWRAIGFVDTLSHAFRLKMPVLLTAGGDDWVCPPDTIESLFQALPGTRSLTYLHKEVHRYTRAFIPLASAWFRLYA